MIIKKEVLNGYMPPQPGYSRLSKQGLVNAVDPPIRDVMRELLLNGFITTSSCAGHITYGEKPYLLKEEYVQTGKRNARTFYNMSGFGYIVFSKQNFDEKLAKQIMIKHGLTGLKKITIIDFEKPHIAFIFNAIGMHHTKRHINAGGPDGAMWEVGD